MRQTVPRGQLNVYLINILPFGHCFIQRNTVAVSEAMNIYFLVI